MSPDRSEATDDADTGTEHMLSVPGQAVRLAVRTISPVSLQLLDRLRAHDPFTYKHSIEVAELSTATGQNLLVSIQEYTLLNLGGALHDIGKLSINSALLTKQPSHDEILHIRNEHMRAGREIISSIPDIPALLKRPLLQVVMLHHELYPNVNGITHPDRYPRNASFPDKPGDIPVADQRDTELPDYVFHAAQTVALADRAHRVLTGWNGDDFHPEAFRERFIASIGIPLSHQELEIVGAMVPACMNIHNDR